VGEMRRINIERIKRFISRKIQKLRFEYGRLFVLEIVLRPSSDIFEDYGHQIEIASGPDDLNTLIDQREKWFGEVILQRFSEGDICFIAKRNGEAIGCIFATFNSVYLPIVEYELPLDNETVGLIDGYTLPEFRGKHVYSSVFNACVDYFSKTDFRRVYGFIIPNDVRSLKVHQKLGLNKIVFDITMIRFLGIRKHLIKPDTRLTQNIL
jgi:RimJ/RimL family protein N-acetyltransferase